MSHSSDIAHEHIETPVSLRPCPSLVLHRHRHFLLVEFNETSGGKAGTEGPSRLQGLKS